MTRRSFADDEKAVSVVIGAIMLVGLIVATTVTIRATYVPVWEEQREADQMVSVATQMAVLVSSLQEQTDEPTGVVLSHPLRLGRDRASFFGGAAAPAEVEFTSAAHPVTLGSNKLLLVVANETSLAGVEESWAAVAGTTFENVTRVDSFRLRIAEVSKNYAGDFVTVTLTDANNLFAGDTQVLVRDNPPDYDIVIRTRDRTSADLYNQGDAYHLSSAISPYWTDLLDPSYRFDKVVAAAEKPMKITVTSTSPSVPHITGDVAITYLQTTSTGTIVIGGSGQVREPYSEDLSGGSVVFRSRNQHLPDREFVIEHGALVVNQTDGAAFKVRPSFEAGLAGSMVSLTMSLPNLVGSSSAVAGSTTATVYTNATLGTTYTANAPRFEITLNTAFPRLWTEFWKRTLEEAGLSSASGHFTVSRTSTTASLTVYGLTTAPGSTVYDLNVNFREARVGIEVRG